MKLTFPHMGKNLTIAVKAMLEYLGRDIVLPPNNSRRTLELGVRYAPEFVCFPFKVTLGNFIEALGNGADVVVMAGGFGPCRFGYYGALQDLILQKIGYKHSTIIIEPRVDDYVFKLKRLSKYNSIVHAAGAFYFGWQKLRLLEWLDYILRKFKPYATQPKILQDLYDNAIKRVDQASDFATIKALKKEFKQNLSQIPLIKEKEFIAKVGIVGEIYVVLEPYVNADIAQRLIDNGVVVDVAVSVGSLIKHQSYQKDKRTAIATASTYLRHRVGGKGNLTVGKALMYAKEGYDGIIHIMPFTCTPENIAKTILAHIAKQINLPILSLTIDEHTTNMAILTRIDAFIELLKRKKYFHLKQLPS